MSAPVRILVPMTPSCACAAARPRTEAEWNAAIRAFSAGRDRWTLADLAELARLRAEWHAARARETVVPAA